MKMLGKKGAMSQWTTGLKLIKTVDLIQLCCRENLYCNLLNFVIYDSLGFADKKFLLC